MQVDPLLHRGAMVTIAHALMEHGVLSHLTLVTFGRDDLTLEDLISWLPATLRRQLELDLAHEQMPSSGLVTDQFTICHDHVNWNSSTGIPKVFAHRIQSVVPREVACGNAYSCFGYGNFSHILRFRAEPRNRPPIVTSAGTASMAHPHSRPISSAISSTPPYGDFPWRRMTLCPKANAIRSRAP